MQVRIQRLRIPRPSQDYATYPRVAQRLLAVDCAVAVITVALRLGERVRPEAEIKRAVQQLSFLPPLRAMSLRPSLDTHPP